MIGRPDLTLHVRQAAADEAQLLNPLPALCADRLPAVTIATAIPGDVIRPRLQGKMRRIEGEIEEKRLVPLLLGVLLRGT